MTGRLHGRNGKYHAVLFYKDKNNKKKQGCGNPQAMTSRETRRRPKRNSKNLSRKTGIWSTPLSTAAQYYLQMQSKNGSKAKKNKLERSTYEGYKSYIDCHIIPYFKPLHLNIDEVTPKHIKDYYENRFQSGKCGKDSGGLSVRSIRKHGVVLKQIFKEAVITEQITRNPATDVPFPTNEKPEFKGAFLNGEEANRMLQAFSEHELQAMVYVTLYYGITPFRGFGTSLELS